MYILLGELHFRYDGLVNHSMIVPVKAMPFSSIIAIQAGSNITSLKTTE